MNCSKHSMKILKICCPLQFTYIFKQPKNYQFVSPYCKILNNVIRNFAVMKNPTCYQFDRTNKKEDKKFQPATHVIFDLDGTVLDSEDIIFCASKKYIKRVFMKTLTWEKYAMVMGTGSKESSKNIIKELKLPINADTYQHGIWQELHQKLQESELMPGVECLVNHLHKCGVPMGLATSSSREMFEVKAKKHKEFFKKFCVMVFSANEPSLNGRNKPKPDIFYLTSKRFPDPPKVACRVLVIEDSIQGVRGALAANMQVLMIPSPRVPQELLKLVEPTLMLRNLNEFDPSLFHLPPY